MKKIISILLSVSMLFAITAELNFSVYADDVISGNCGDNLVWLFNESTGELRITGYGEMWNYRCSDIAYPRDDYGVEYGFDQFEPEWKSQKCKYTSLVIENGVTSIGTAAFAYGKISSVIIPESVKQINYQAFYMVNKLFKAYFEGNSCTISNRAFIDTYANTVEPEKFNGTFYCSKYSDIYSYAVENNIDYCIPETECSHIAYYKSERGCYYCKLCGSFLFLKYDGSYVCKEHDLTLSEEKSPDCINDGYKKYMCLVCGEIISETLPATGHDYIRTVTEPKCTEQGYTTYTCTRCNDTCISGYTPAKGHTVVIDKSASPSCTETGLTAGSHCSVCGTVITAQNVVSATGHSWNNGAVTKPATCSEAGVKTYTCTVCGEMKTEEIAKTAHTYSDYVTPAAPVQNTAQTTNTTVATASSTATVKKPKATSIKKLTKGKKSFKVTWKKVSGVSGYQIQYSTDKNFKKNNKTVTVSKNGTTSKTVSKLKGKKKYYVRIRTYKTVNGTKYYSSWSKAKSVTAKK